MYQTLDLLLTSFPRSYQKCYGALLDVYVNMFGQVDGENLAAADSGPIDEAYVGGGS